MPIPNVTLSPCNWKILGETSEDDSQSIFEKKIKVWGNYGDWWQEWKEWGHGDWSVI